MSISDSLSIWHFFEGKLFKISSELAGVNSILSLSVGTLWGSGTETKANIASRRIIESVKLGQDTILSLFIGVLANRWDEKKGYSLKSVSSLGWMEVCGKTGLQRHSPRTFWASGEALRAERKNRCVLRRSGLQISFRPLVVLLLGEEETKYSSSDKLCSWVLKRCQDMLSPSCWI